MVYVFICFGIIILDFITKKWAQAVLKAVETVPLINGVFHLTYVENRGAAFGMLANMRFVFIALTLAVIAAICVWAVKQKNKPPILCLAMSFTLGGAIGNMIDRIACGYVTDLFDFRLINFPVFNVADIFVCIGAALFAVFFIFEDKFEKKD